MISVRRVCAYAFAALLLWSHPALAQQTCPCPPPEPPPGNWVGSAGLGFSLNRGNTETTNLNVSFDAAYDPKKKDLWKFQGIYLRGETDGEVSVDRLFLQGRYERKLTPRA